MKLSDGEKLAIVMLTEVYQRVVPNGEVNPEFVKNAICGGHAWALDPEYKGVFSKDADEAVVRETVDVLSMWDDLEGVFENWDPAIRHSVKDLTSRHWPGHRFAGFDGNDGRGHFGVAQFLVEKMNRFSRFKHRGLNSHYPASLDRYRYMRAEYDHVTREPFPAPNRFITPENFIDIVTATGATEGRLHD